MPANKRYLLSSGWARASKLIAAVFGGALITVLLQNLAGILWGWDIVILSLWFSFPCIWIAIMCWVYWIRSPWGVWAGLISIGLISSGIIYFLK